MTFQPTYKRGISVAREATWGTIPTAGVYYNGGGKWFPALVTSAPGSLRGVGPHIRPMGQVGRRDAHQYAPVPAGRHSEGSLDIDFASDVGGLFLVASLGGVSTVLTADAGNPLAASAALGSSPATITPTNPTTSAFIRITIAAAGGGNGTAVVSGVTASGETTSEDIAISGNGTFYTRRSYDTVSSIVITHTLTGSPTVQVDGYIKGVHTITGADTQPSLTIEEAGDPSAGSGNSWFYTGMLIESLGITFDATDEQGLLVISPQFNGKYPTAATASTFQKPVHTAFPAWTGSVTRDGVAYARVQGMNATLTTGSRPVRTANGTRDPQGAFHGARMFEGQLTIALEDATEYTDWENRTVRDFTLTFDTPYKLDASTNHKLVLEMTEAYLTDFTPGDADGLATATFDFYTLSHPTDGVLKATLTNAVASYA